MGIKHDSNNSMGLSVTIVGTVIDYTEETLNGTTRKRSVIVGVDDGNWTHTYCIDFYNNQIDKFFENILIGDEMRFHCNLTGKEWVNPEGKKYYFHSLVCFGCKSNSEPTTTGKERTKNVIKSTPKEEFPKYKKTKQPDLSDYPDDDLPF